jgi:hypothetical protein
MSDFLAENWQADEDKVIPFLTKSRLSEKMASSSSAFTAHYSKEGEDA